MLHPGPRARFDYSREDITRGRPVYVIKVFYPKAGYTLHLGVKLSGKLTKPTGVGYADLPPKKRSTSRVSFPTVLGASMYSKLEAMCIISIVYESYSVVAPATNSPSRLAQRPLYPLPFSLLARTPRPDRLTKLQHIVCMVSHADGPGPVLC